MTEGFHQGLLTRQPEPGENRLVGYITYSPLPMVVCGKKAPLTQVAEFLNGLRTVRHRDKPLALRTIAGYRSAIAGVYQVFPDDSMVSSNADLSTLLKGIFVIAARPIYDSHGNVGSHDSIEIP